MLEVKRKEGESPNALLFRFTKRVKRSGLLKEAKKRRFHDRPENRRKRRLSALHRITKRAELDKEKKRVAY
ncbi:MAG: 30S ribosomal protein S21 [Anaplasmataceae bacterium]|nr:30S ribosomal protein S21 [Anaplasmataceae bacterium]